MVHTFVSVFYSNAVGRNMNVVSEKLLCLKRKEESLPKFCKYIFISEIKLYFVFVSF
jgi:hypothetical protein